ncbi:MAG TPA: prolyl-tRNA synthetase associated domain-containing protein [Stellaceae bacterium]|nr:prolyl-tRNA synthetase associated domain-containing protein [Stellaceae bacterium]
MAIQDPQTAFFAYLNDIGVAHTTIEHPPIHTIEEALPYWSQLEGVHAKNLFLKDAKGQLWLICLPAERRADLKALAPLLGAKRFSFASAELLEQVLGVRQGAVSPFALLNDRDRQVRLALDAALIEAPRLAFHPLVNTATTAVATADFLRFVEALGYRPEILTLD